MPGFDILAGPSLYDGVVGAGSNTPNFDILAPNPASRPLPGQGQNGAAPNGLQPNGQPQGAPVSGLVAGLMGMPTYAGAVPGASYLTPPQMQPQQAQQPVQTVGMAQLGSLTGAGQPQSLFDALVNGAR